MRGPGSRALRLALALLLAALAPAVPASDFQVESLAIEMDELDAKVLLYKDLYDTSSFPVTVVMPDGKRMPGRIKWKGGFSRKISPKKPLSIKLDSGHKWHGQSRLGLNAMGVDRSHMREWLAWDLIHSLGMAAPRSRYLRLSVNGADWGLFYWIEWIDGGVFDRHGLGREGEMYDPVDAISCADLSPVSVLHPEVCWDKPVPPDGDYGSLVGLIEASDAAPVETFDAFVEKHFHAESVINYFAVTILVSNTTTYNDEYFPFLSRKTGKWTVIPWAYDRSFGWNYEPYFDEPVASNSDAFQYWYPVELGVYNPLRDKLLSNPALRARLLARLGELLEGAPTPAQPWRGWFEPQAMQRRLDALYAVVQPQVATDPFLVEKQGRFEEAAGAIRHYSLARALYFRRVLAPGDFIRDVAGGALPAAGAAAHYTDGWGYYLAGLRARERAGAGELKVDLVRGWPELVPPGAARDACVQRTWHLASSAAVTGDVTVEYREENSQNTDKAPAVRDEYRLQLYARTRAGWWRLHTRVNALANTLSGSALPLPAGERVRLVACDLGAQQTAAAGR